MKLPGFTTIGLRLVPPWDTGTPLADRQLIRFIGDVSLTPSSASVIGALPVSAATRFARSGRPRPDCRMFLSGLPSWPTSPTPLGRRAGLRSDAAGLLPPRR